MRITKFHPPVVFPPAEYVLRLSYNELHTLYHLMLDRYRDGDLQSGTEEAFFQVLREHA